VLATDDPRGTLGSPSQRRDTMQYVVDVLDEIGLRADLKVAPTINQYWRSIYAGEGQAWLSGWITDIPRASDFIGTQFRCGTPFTIVGYVCAEGVEAKMSMLSSSRRPIRRPRTACGSRPSTNSSTRPWWPL
jgi:ABC-type transport system substrate-binding protein